jgi:hypothetical protein
MSLSLARIWPDTMMSTNFHKIRLFVPFLDDLMPHAVLEYSIFGHPPSIISKNFESSHINVTLEKSNDAKWRAPLTLKFN